ncbi:15631_t:CDS:1, partial [Racocetra persica]
SFNKLSDLPIPLQRILPPSYEYQIENYSELEPIITVENVTIGQLIVDLFVNINTQESALEWFNVFQEISKTTMRLT